MLHALQFEKANWANGSVLDDSFYECSADDAQASPETLLKVEKDINTTPYLIPARTALFKILYQSEKLDGSSVPVSDFIL